MQVETMRSKYEDEKRRRAKRTADDTAMMKWDLLLQKEQMVKKFKDEYEAEKTQINQNFVQQKLLLAEEHQKVVDDMDVQIKNLESQTTLEKDARFDEIQALNMRHEEEKAAVNNRLKADFETLRGALTKRGDFKSISDHELSIRFRKIFMEVDSLARILWDKRCERMWPLTEYAMRKAENIRRTKQYIIQNILWAVLYEMIFCSPFICWEVKEKFWSRSDI